MTNEPTYAELIAIFDSPASSSSINITDKRRAVILRALNIAASLEAAEWPAAHLLTEHPPCEHIAKPFDLKTLTFSQRYMFGRIRDSDVVLHYAEINETMKVLKESGLVEQQNASGSPDLFRFALTAKGRAAR